jgi:hypothetical protein
MKAYIFVKFASDVNMEQVRHAVSEPQIKGLDLILGPYDAVVSVQTDNFAALGKLAQRIRSCPGIKNSITCPVIE